MKDPKAGTGKTLHGGFIPCVLNDDQMVILFPIDGLTVFAFSDYPVPTLTGALLFYGSDGQYHSVMQISIVDAEYLEVVGQNREQVHKFLDKATTEFYTVAQKGLNSVPGHPVERTPRLMITTPDLPKYTDEQIDELNACARNVANTDYTYGAGTMDYTREFAMTALIEAWSFLCTSLNTELLSPHMTKWVSHLTKGGHMLSKLPN
jgi:hypothetical protein